MRYFVHTAITLGWLAILDARKDVALKVRLIYEQRCASSGIEHRLVDRLEEAGTSEFLLVPLSELVPLATDDRPYRIPVELNKRIAIIAYERTRESNALMQYMTKDLVIELCDQILE